MRHLLRIATALGKLAEDAAEHPHLAPTNEPVVDCLVRPVACGHVAPPQTIADHKDDAADHRATAERTEIFAQSGRR